MKLKKKSSYIALFLLAAFVLWTAAVCFVDVKAIGPMGSEVGFAAINGFIHKITGVNMTLYVITDWLGLVPIGVAFGFAVLGFAQWIKRGSILKVDRNILALGIFYIAVMAAYAFFEYCVVNCRPVLTGGMLEASYPSSTTVLAICVMSTAAMQLNMRMKNPVLKKYAALIINAFTVFMVAGRLISGVHWLSDIIGGVLLGAGLVMMYYAFVCSEK